MSEPTPALRTFAPPPAGFDVHTATAETLRRHGLPRRPDPETEPRLNALWQRAFLQPVEFIEADLEVDPETSYDDLGPSSATEFSGQNWGGLGIRRAQDDAEFNQPAIMAFGEFTVPHVSAVNPTGDAMIVGFWVGIDGLFMAGDQVLQAGVAAKVHSSGFGASSVDYWAWTEWWSVARKDPSHRINNFEVRAGDQIAVLVCATEPDYGRVTLLNRRTGKATSIGLRAPQGVHLTGSSVEWVVEGVSKGLPDFGTVTFADCLAATEKGLFDLRPKGVPLDITVPTSGGGWGPGESLTRTHVASDDLLAVQWLGFM